MNSRQGNRYIKTRMGNDLKQKILIHNGIIPPEEMKNKPSVRSCPRCELVNVIENKYCSKCSYPLTSAAFEEIKLEEDNKILRLNEKYEKEDEGNARRDGKETRSDLNQDRYEEVKPVELYLPILRNTLI